MKLKQLFTDDDAVSPVIGVILMVAITVILAAVIGAFVLDIGGSQEKVPQASWDFSFSESDNELTVSHEGGDSVNVERLSFSGTIDNVDSISSSQWADPVDAGDSVILDDGTNGIDVDSSNGVETDDEVQLVWTSSGGDQSQVLQEWSGPDA